MHNFFLRKERNTLQHRKTANCLNQLVVARGRCAHDNIDCYLYGTEQAKGILYNGLYFWQSSNNLAITVLTGSSPWTNVSFGVFWQRDRHVVICDFEDSCYFTIVLYSALAELFEVQLNDYCISRHFFCEVVAVVFRKIFRWQKYTSPSCVLLHSTHS